MDLLRVENIYAGYGKREVLKDVSFYLGGSEIVVLIGPNGAGKSTLLKVVAGFLNPYAGKVIWNDDDITYMPAFQRTSLGIIYLMQGGRVFPNLTVEENLRLVISSRLCSERFEEVFSVFPELRVLLKRRAGLLSGGERQQLALAMILLKRPRLMLLDEPSAGLSPYLVSEIMEKIKEIRNIFKSGVILVEQNVAEALKISDRVCILMSGKIVKESENSLVLLRDNSLEEIFFGEVKGKGGEQV